MTQRSALALTLLTACLTSLSAMAEWGVPSGEYGLDKTHGYISFSYSHLGFSKPTVGFEEFEVSLNANADDPTQSDLSVTINAASIDSRVAVFDDHLNGVDYFDTEKFPTITFTSKQIEATGDNTFDVTGDLTIKDVTKPVTLAATVNKAGNHPILNAAAIGVSASATIKRSEWNLNKYVPLVSDEVTLSIEVELPKKP